MQTNPVKVIREKCLDCCCGSTHEVKLCTAERCPLWPWRMGKNPYRKPPSEAKAAAARRMNQKRLDKENTHIDAGVKTIVMSDALQIISSGCKKNST